MDITWWKKRSNTSNDALGNVHTAYCEAQIETMKCKECISLNSKFIEVFLWWHEQWMFCFQRSKVCLLKGIWMEVWFLGMKNLVLMEDVTCHECREVEIHIMWADINPSIVKNAFIYTCKFLTVSQVFPWRSHQLESWWRGDSWLGMAMRETMWE